jgi:peptidoglycan/LPS O-acetylase OafA/YrhL
MPHWGSAGAGTVLTFDNYRLSVPAPHNEGCTMVREFKRLPALDGVRGIAILLVLVGHSLSLRHDAESMMIGRLGVVVFFVLSGYLITGRLLMEEERQGAISIKNFYRRRALRIFPAFYTFLSICAVLAWWKVIPSPNLKAWLSCAFYFRNYVADQWSSTSHLWSLALEEQFYFLWPAFFLLTRKHRLPAVGLAVAGLSAYRAIWVYTHPLAGIESNLHAEYYMNTLLIGAAFAIFRPTWVKTLRVSLLCSVLAAWWVFGLLRWAAPFHGTVSALLIGAIIYRFSDAPGRMASRLLCHPALVFSGVLSYSVYLWQQMFLGPNLRWWSFPALAAVAGVSYFCIERPFLRLKDRPSPSHRSVNARSVEIVMAPAGSD